MIFRIIGCLFIILCIIGILNAYHNTNKKNKRYILEAIIKSDRKSSKLESYIRLFSKLFGPILLGILLINILFGTYNESLFLALLISYLIVYYMTQYLPHSHWIIHKEVLVSMGSNQCIKWENISSYRWLRKNDYDILIIQFKGNGIITQRADFIISDTEKKQVSEILSEKVLIRQI